ncbi:amino acid ABC transporter permease [Neorhizobium galegae]|uniref:amino acid ABC transporter permease n=1 Tax=Neorhizobium galegae TaxID=399 RepID=UPI000620F559|nr:amino acid ABC transporter permease [Neorhizobium galegae]CDZ64578.1 Ectoine/hydroxyectoine ABC transporter, permease protein EhuC [Neorhizobium galegae bv. orientalis]KAB1119969.1 amino acid ABC transporter permease [Neorhizobium galegae]MCQ1575285.1 amino acid ABC transporter permease [Neorhizobium galegae]MCQ1808952.1 amino acid ABC transporter permease [Neorhizobium galegae]MCQ1838733.1 amino acid ABC transporter permease [Neorhizobium galegae]
MNFFQIILGIYEGFWITAIVMMLGLLYAVPFALLAGVLQHFSTGATRWVVTGIIEFWRSSPVIVLLYAFYYSLPAFGIYLSAIGVGSMVLGLNIGGYGSQSVRAALQSLSRGQSEAGLALGLGRFQVLRFVELPQAIAAMIPTFINQAIQLIKGTSLVSLLTLTDMTFRAKEIAQVSYNPVAVYSGLLLSYLIICYPVTILGRHMEKSTTKGRGGHNDF